MKKNRGEETNLLTLQAQYFGSCTWDERTCSDDYLHVEILCRGCLGSDGPANLINQVQHRVLSAL